MCNRSFTLVIKICVFIYSLDTLHFSCQFWRLVFRRWSGFSDYIILSDCCFLFWTCTYFMPIFSSKRTCTCAMAGNILQLLIGNLYFKRQCPAYGTTSCVMYHKSTDSKAIYPLSMLVSKHCGWCHHILYKYIIAYTANVDTSLVKSNIFRSKIVISIMNE